MRFKSLISLGIGSVILSSALIFTSCTPKITDEQLLELKELRKKERVVNDDISKKKDEKAALEKELKARKSELDKCTTEMNYVKEKLALWPNCWPDWSPEPPPPATEPEKKSKKKK